METIISNISRSVQLKSALTSEKLTESNVQNERAITWLDKEKVCFLVKTKINVNEEWLEVGNTGVEEFKNSKENLKLLKSNVPEPFLSAVLAIWETPTEIKKLDDLEVLEDGKPKKLSD